MKKVGLEKSASQDKEQRIEPIKKKGPGKKRKPNRKEKN